MKGPRSGLVKSLSIILIFGPQVTHLLPADTTNLEDYILLHPDAAKYIWFPDIYIGNQSQWR